MACGDTYRYLAVTSGGNSLDNPYDDVATFTDYEEWLSLTRDLALLAQQHTDALGEAEAPAVARWNAANDVKSAMISGLEELPSPYLNFSPSENISDAIAVVLRALCVIEMSRVGIVELGGDLPELPGTVTPHENEDILPTIGAGLGIGAVIIAGGLAVVIFSKVRR